MDLDVTHLTEIEVLREVLTQDEYGIFTVSYEKRPTIEGVILFKNFQQKFVSNQFYDGMNGVLITEENPRLNTGEDLILYESLVYRVESVNDVGGKGELYEIHLSPVDRSVTSQIMEEE